MLELPSPPTRPADGAPPFADTPALHVHTPIAHDPTLSRRALCTLALTLPWSVRATPQPTPALVLGVVPYLSARRLVDLYEPLRWWLSTELGAPVLIESAPDYTVYLERTALGQYDVIATSPYFGRLAQREQGYLPLARPTNDMEPMLVTHKSSSLLNVEGLRGQVVTTSDRLANLTLAAHRYLVANRLRPGTDITLRPMGSHANSLAALEAGESAAAVITATALKQVGGQWEDRLRVLVRLDRLPPLLYLAHRRLGEPTIARLQRRLITFANEQAAGRRFTEALGHGGLQAIAESDMKALDPFVSELKKMNIPLP